MHTNPLTAYINGRSCALLGLGVSHLPLAELLLREGISLTVYDKKSPSDMGEEALSLAARGVRFVTGDGCFDRIGEDLILRSPGIRPDLAGLSAAVARGAELTSEIELLLRLTEAESFAVTGSDGKTTSTTLTGLFLRAEAMRRGTGQVYVGGNIGTPLLPLCHRMTAQDTAVLELSSFQLMTLSSAPRYAALTNLSPNHLDWHRGMEEYIAAKKSIVGQNTARFVTNAENPPAAELGREIAAKGGIEVFFFSSRRSCPQAFASELPSSARLIYEREGVVYLWDGQQENPVLSTACIRVPGRHNLENVMTAVALTWGHVEPSLYENVLGDFTGVEHRLEYVRTLDGVDYFNSSIDSSPTRTAAALSALEGRDIVVICGGYDKQIPYAPLADSLCRHARAVVLTGATAGKIRDALENCPDFSADRLTVAWEPDFEGAVRKARELARRGGCVLLSPASASFDAFKNFAQRGEVFKRIVHGL